MVRNVSAMEALIRGTAAVMCGVILLSGSAARAEYIGNNPVPMPNEVQRKWVTQEMLDAECYIGAASEIIELCVQILAAQLPPIDNAKREHFGEFYDPAGYLRCRRDSIRRGQRTDSSCEFRRLRRAENPEYWPYPDVPPPKWPDAPDPPTYKPGMTSDEYFDALCAKEAGEFIYKTVDDVEGIYQIRPRARATDYEMQDRFVIEDPFGYISTGSVTEPQDIWVQPYVGEYRFLEVLDGSSIGRKSQFTRYFRNREKTPARTYPSARDGRPAYVPYIVDDAHVPSLSSRYGFTWRGISRPGDRSLGIAGGELIVVDLENNEILALRRGFARTGRTRNAKGGVWWLNAQTCEQTKRVLNGKPRKIMEHDFVYRVLKPVKTINTSIEGGRSVEQ